MKNVIGGGYLHNLMCMFMRVCGWVHACVHFSFCLSKSSDFFFFLIVFLQDFYHQDWKTDSPVPWTSYVSYVQDIFCKSNSLLLETFDILWS